MMANRLPAEIFRVPFDLGSVIEIVDAANWLEPEFGDSKADYETRALEASELWKLIESNELTDDIVASNFADWSSVLYYQEADDDDPLEIPREFTRAVIAGDAAKLTKLLAHYEFHGALLGDEITRLAAYLAPDRMVNVRPHGDLLAAVSSRSRNVDWGRAYIEGGATLAKAIQAKGLSPSRGARVVHVLSLLDLCFTWPDDPAELQTACSFLRELVTSDPDEIWVGHPSVLPLRFERELRPSLVTVPNPYENSGRFGFGRYLVPAGSIQPPEMAVSGVNWRDGPRTGFLADGSESRYVMGGFHHPFEHGYVLQLNLRDLEPTSAGARLLTYAGRMNKKGGTDNREGTAALHSLAQALSPTTVGGEFLIGEFDPRSGRFTQPVAEVLGRLVGVLLARGAMESKEIRAFVQETFPETGNSIDRVERWVGRR